MKKLAGTTFIRNGLTYDYNFLETIKCLLDFCDHVFVVEAGSDDGTDVVLKGIDSPKLTVIYMNDWDAQKGTGQTKLCYYTDIAIAAAQDAGYEYTFYCQCDEILHERSYPEVRKAIEMGAEGYLITRINLWQDPYHQLNVPQERKPCSTSIVRLAKTTYRSYGDAESLAVPYADAYFHDSIQLWHYGFVRKKS